MSAAPALVVVATDGRPLDRLGASIRRFNVDSLPVQVVRADEHPAAILDLWRSTDHEVCVVVAPSVEFVRPFGAHDFVMSDGVPYTVLSEEPERRVDGAGDLERLDSARAAAADALGLADRRRFVARGVSVVSTAVLRAFHDDVLRQRGWSYVDALAVCDDELAWHHTWLRVSAAHPVVLREPLVVPLDTPARREAYRLAGVTAADVARGYLGVLWPADDDPDHHQASAAAVLGAHLTAGQITRALTRRITRTAPRVQRWLRLDPNP